MVRDHHTPPSPDPAGPGTESKLAHPFQPTPEPWELLEDSIGVSVCTRIEDELIVLAEFPIFHQSPLSMRNKRPAGEVRSNARLFLASPRLLHALRLLCKLIPEGASAKEAFAIHQGNIDGERLAAEILRELEGGGQ